MIGEPAGSTFTLKRVQQMLGLSRAVVDGLIGAGFVTPARGQRNEYRFSFRDLMLLRTAHSLQAASIPPRKVLRALTSLQARLPAELPLTGLRLTAIGSDVVVGDRLGPWEADSGQLVMDFEVTSVGGDVVFLEPAPVTSPSAEQWFLKGEALEDTDAAAAEAAYRRAIELEPAHVFAHVNLGAMLCEAGRYDEASALYETALTHGADSPLFHFNHAVALEDSGHPEAAVEAYARCVALDAAFADAHHNLARLLDRLGDPRGALRHFSAYRRLEV